MVLRASWGPLGLLLGALGGILGTVLVRVGPKLSSKTDLPSFEYLVVSFFRFLPCMTAGLAYYISMKKSPDRLVALKQIYEDEFQRAAAQDGERTSLFLTPKTYFPSV